MQKQCRKCKIVKDVGEFWKDKRNKDGLRCWCKDCGTEFNRTWQKKNPDKVII